MEPEYWSRVKPIFDAAVLLEGGERVAYLYEACGSESELRREVEALLESYKKADDFLETPFAGEIANSLLESATDELEQGHTVGRYKIVRKVGAGGMGTVYLARDIELKRQVAIKLLSARATIDPDRVSRFVQEARLASVLNHPHILTIYEIGQIGKTPFIASEFVDGDTLRTRLDKSPMQLEEAVDIAINTASALVVAHQAGIIHRDIKPENIMLREDGLLKVLDFGMAKLNRSQPLAAESVTDTWDSVRTNPGLVIGTVSYMSPEQAMGYEVDERTDVWSLGVVLYESISGAPPFRGLSHGDVVSSILSSEPEPLGSAHRNLTSRLNQIIERALSKSIDDRYMTMREMLDDLKMVRAEIDRSAPMCRSVAILPFTNLTGDTRVSFFEFALADAVITEVARSASLIVRPSSSVAKFLGTKRDPLAIGEELEVDAVLAANFLVSEKRIRVTTQLIDVRDKNVIWGEQIDSTTDDIIELQDMITHRIVEGLHCELETFESAGISLPSTANSHAYVEYLQGRDQLRRYMFHTVANENVDIAIRHFRRAIDLDPKFALAHAALGTCYLQKVIKIVGTRADIERAAAAFDRALDLEPQLVDARAYRALIARLQGETQKSRDELAELRRDQPNNFEVQYISAAFYRHDGNYEKAFRCYEEMLRIDPTARVSVHYCRARIFWYRGRFDLSYRELEQARQLEPNHPIIKFFHAIVTFRSGDPAAAVEELRTLLLTYPCKAFQAYLAICLSALGQFDAARDQLTDEVEEIGETDPDVSYWLATANLMAGRRDEAFRWLERSIFLGNHNLKWFQTDSIWMPMHGDRRYADLMSRVSTPLQSLH